MTEHQHFWGDFPRDPTTGLFRCACGETKTLWQIFLSTPLPPSGYDWYLTPNVTEGEHFESDADHHQTVEGEKV